MDIQKQYEKIVDLQTVLKENKTASSFLKNHQEELCSILDISSLEWIKTNTKEFLCDLLQEQQSKLSLQIQSAGLHIWLHDKKVLPLKSALQRKRKEEIAKINYLPMILQLACSHPEHYFRKNFENKISHKELIDYVVIDPNMVPQWFLDAFQIESVDIDGGNIKDFFKKAKPLQYHKEKKEITWRVVFIDGKLVVFRELQQLLHKEDTLTQWEKRRIDYKKYFNTYDDIYSALRSQQYIVDKQEGKVEEYKDIQKSMIELIQDIKFSTKHGDEKRQLEQIISDVKNATSFYIMASKFYNLFKIDFINKSIDANKMIGASNKISKELHRFRSIIMEIQLQSDALQQLLDMQEYTFQTLSIQSSKAIVHRDSGALFTAFQQYYKQSWTDLQKTEPFISFDNQIKTLFWPTLDKNQMKSHRSILQAEILLSLQKIYFQIYQLEHKIKLWTVKSTDFVFDTNLCTKYPELYKPLFIHITKYTNQIQKLGTIPLSQYNKDFCISLLQQLKKLPDWESNIQALKNF